MQRTDEILLVRLFLRSTLTNWKGVSISKCWLNKLAANYHATYYADTHSANTFTLLHFSSIKLALSLHFNSSGFLFSSIKSALSLHFDYSVFLNKKLEPCLVSMVCSVVIVSFTLTSDRCVQIWFKDINIYPLKSKFLCSYIFLSFFHVLHTFFFLLVGLSQSIHCVPYYSTVVSQRNFVVTLCFRQIELTIKQNPSTTIYNSTLAKILVEYASAVSSLTFSPLLFPQYSTY